MDSVIGKCLVKLCLTVKRYDLQGDAQIVSQTTGIPVIKASGAVSGQMVMVPVINQTDLQSLLLKNAIERGLGNDTGR
ncbi:MAG TPA: hypothetical protein DEP33_10325 [Alteromonas sp.]|nr:hypothetical protein [Alteromonas sp.]HCL12646.1 hypothetical protein [Alteromonas sp.]